MKIIIIGDTGFIGKTIYEEIERLGEFELIGISTKDIDLTNKQSPRALSEYLLDCVVIMCAGVKKQLGDNLTTFERNLAIINNFSRAISINSPKKVIFLSSASVYGEDVTYSEKIREETPADPRSYYGISKYVGERTLEKVCADTQTHLVILRPPLVYGKGDLSRGYGPSGFAHRVLNREEIVLWGDGSEFREFIFIDDVGRIVNRLIKHDIKGAINLVSGNSYTFKQIIDNLEILSESSVSVVSRLRTKEKVDHHYSNSIIKSVLGDLEFTGLSDGLRQTYISIRNELK